MYVVVCILHIISIKFFKRIVKLWFLFPSKYFPTDIYPSHITERKIFVFLVYNAKRECKKTYFGITYETLRQNCVPVIRKRVFRVKQFLVQIILHFNSRLRSYGRNDGKMVTSLTCSTHGSYYTQKRERKDFYLWG